LLVRTGSRWLVLRVAEGYERGVDVCEVARDADRARAPVARRPLSVPPAIATLWSEKSNDLELGLACAIETQRRLRARSRGNARCALGDDDRGDIKGAACDENEPDRYSEPDTSCLSSSSLSRFLGIVKRREEVPFHGRKLATSAVAGTTPEAECGSLVAGTPRRTHGKTRECAWK
jgi:hypothetical protein